jgi:hypothetical protein
VFGAAVTLLILSGALREDKEHVNKPMFYMALSLFVVTASVLFFPFLIGVSLFQ